MTKANQQSITRRSVVAGAVASLPATAIISPALGCAPDPIFAAIDRHAAAFLHWSALLCHPDMELPANDPRCEAAEKAALAACDPEAEAAEALTNIIPTTWEGLIALVAYINHFNQGELYGPAGTDKAYSDHYLWPDELEDGETLNARGKPLRLPFTEWVLRNIETALRELRGAA
jgi:hypothetical protein